MILNFLQTRNPPVLPCLHRRPHQKLVGADGKPSAFADDVVSLSAFGDKNKETLGELLFHFFRKYAHELDYETYVISIREGALISKEAKKWHLMQNNRLCVEEPFNIERNLGNTVDDISFRGVHLELRRAFDLVCECKLEECMAEYIFPPVEEKFWEKPPPKPAPTLTPSQPNHARNGRGGFVNRGARHGSNQHRVGQQGRRASSAATSNKLPNAHAIAQSLTIPKHPLQAQYEQQQLHDQLINEYQYLQAQEHELRLAQAQAQLIQAHRVSAMPSSSQQISRDQLARPTTTPQPPMTAPLQHAQSLYPYPIHTQPLGPVHTNPSSPSMKPVQPDLRRTSNRSKPASEASSASLRSHSQPARPYQAALPLPNPQALMLNGYTLQHLRQQQAYHLEAQSRLRQPEVQSQVPFQYDPRYEDNIPKEYVGYYVHDSPPPRRHLGDTAMSRQQTYHDLAHGMMGGSNGFDRLHGPSRSPSRSPSLPIRDRSTSVRSVMSAPSDPMLMRKSMSSSHHRASGPIIVDGSDAWCPTEHQVDTFTERGTRTIGRSKYVSEVDFKVAAGESQSRRPGRSESIISDAGQRYLNQPLPPHEAQRILENGRGLNSEPLRRQYPQVNGTAPAPAAMRYAESLTNGHGPGSAAPESLSQAAPLPSSRGMFVGEDKHHVPSPSSGKPSPDLSEISQDQPAKAVQPLLSPVREVRTPSPTVSRKEGGPPTARTAGKLAQRYPVQEIPPFSGLGSGRQKPNESLNGRSNTKVGAVNGTQTSHPTDGGWQQTTSKKYKKHKVKGSNPLIANTAIGETLPGTAAERKGG